MDVQKHVEKFTSKKCQLFYYTGFFGFLSVFPVVALPTKGLN